MYDWHPAWKAPGCPITEILNRELERHGVAVARRRKLPRTTESAPTGCAFEPLPIDDRSGQRSAAGHDHYVDPAP
jgi:hypothetical protein